MRMMIASALFLFAASAFGAENKFTVEQGPALAPISDAAPQVQDAEMLRFDCASEPGRTFCMDLRRFDSLLFNCSGTACYSVWDAQLRVIDDIDFWYRRNIYRGDTVSIGMAEDSRIVAMRLCSVRLTGDARYIAALAVSYNNLVSILGDMQDMGGVRFPHTCRFNVN